MDLRGLSLKFEEARNYRYFAAISLPEAEDIWFFCSNRIPEMKKVEIQKSSKPAFLFSPYGAGNMCYHLDAEKVYRNEELIRDERITDDEEVKDSANPDSAKGHCASREEFIHYVSKAVNEIRLGKCRKIVTARKEHLATGMSFQPASFFHTLKMHYPSACVYYFTSPENGTWMGASPEKLVSVHEGNLNTIAMAGTMASGEDRAWTEKEKEEQHITGEFIKNVLEENKKAKVEISESTEMSAGNVKHIVQSIRWNPGEEWMQKSFSKLLARLNPTPAVCGFPASRANDFIVREEGIERRFYSGFIGMQKEGIDLFVNIRCMEITKGDAWFYAGAGITKDSDPEMEWEETAAKLDTLKSLLPLGM